MKSLKEIRKPETLYTQAKPIRNKSWGYHLLMDVSECNERMTSIPDIKEFFSTLIKEIDMEPLSPIMIEKVDSEEYGRGISAVQMIITSSITFHADDKHMCIYIDVFSCKPFKPEKALRFVKFYFQPSHISSRMIYRDAGPAKNEQD